MRRTAIPSALACFTLGTCLLVAGCGGSESGDDDSGGGAGDGAELAQLACEDVVTESYLVDEMGVGPLERYDREVTTNIDGETVLGCSFEMGEGESSRGGIFTVSPGDEQDYEGTLAGMQAMSEDDVQVTDDVGTSSFEYGPIEISAVTQAEQSQIWFLTSEGGYFAGVLVQTFYGEPSMPHARSIAAEVDQSLSD